MNKYFTRLLAGVFTVVLTVSVLFPISSLAAFDANRIMDDGVFNNSGSMTASQIDAFLNSFPSSCISPNKGFHSPDVIGYNPSQGFLYGGNTSAGTVISNASKAYDISPQVILATLQKEQSLVSGGAGCHYETPPTQNPCPDPPYGTSASCVTACQYAGGCVYIAMGYDCPYYCVPSSMGFSQQIIKAAWKLKFVQQRSLGNYDWNVQKPGWDNSDDPQTPYSGYMTQGTFKRNASSSPTYFDGLRPVNNNSLTVHLGTGATASLYSYTPFTSGNTNFVNIFEGWFGSVLSCDYGRGQTAPPTNAFGNADLLKLPGNWTSSSKQGFAYLSPNGTGGFDAAIMDTGDLGGLTWRGTWWHQTNGAIGIANTIFIPVKNSAGLTDLYYATSTNWSRPGFTIGHMANTGNGFAYQGSKWSPSSLSLATTRFVPGNWTSTGYQSIAYATPNGSGGFDLGVMDPGYSSLQWRGTWWSQTNGSIGITNTTLIPGDANGDGFSDLYYASSTNWSRPGFAVSLMGNNGGSGMSWWGPQWNNGSLRLDAIKFMPGKWTGGTKQGFAYTTQCGTKGFDLGVMDPGANGLEWRGTWWEAPSLPYRSTAFIPADANGDGYTDLYYATPTGNGFSMALQRTNTTGGFTWAGQQWPSTLPLNAILFLN